MTLDKFLDDILAVRDKFDSPSEEDIKVMIQGSSQFVIMPIEDDEKVINIIRID